MGKKYKKRQKKIVFDRTLRHGFWSGNGRMWVRRRARLALWRKRASGLAWLGLAWLGLASDSDVPLGSRWACALRKYAYEGKEREKNEYLLPKRD